MVPPLANVQLSILEEKLKVYVKKAKGILKHQKEAMLAHLDAVRTNSINLDN